MGTYVQTRFSFVDRKVGLYEEEVEAWKGDHETIKNCYTLEELFRNGSVLFDEICRFDEHWHLDVFSDLISYDEGVANQIRSLFEKWKRVADDTMSIFSDMRHEYTARGFDVDVTLELVARQRKCAAILTPSCEAYPDLVDAAVDAYEAGETTEF